MTDRITAINRNYSVDTLDRIFEAARNKTSLVAAATDYKHPVIVFLGNVVEAILAACYNVSQFYPAEQPVTESADRLAFSFYEMHKDPHKEQLAQMIFDSVKVPSKKASRTECFTIRDNRGKDRQFYLLEESDGIWLMERVMRVTEKQEIVMNFKCPELAKDASTEGDQVGFGATRYEIRDGKLFSGTNEICNMEKIALSPQRVHNEQIYFEPEITLEQIRSAKL